MSAKKQDDQTVSAISASQLTGSPANSNPSPESAASSCSAASCSARPRAIDRKAPSGGELETPLSVFKLSPLSMFINNKVGSSFQDQRLSLISYAQGMQSALVLPVTSRRVRDSGSLLFMLTFLGLLGYVIWDGLVVKEADINLIVHGHDSYGNICGRNNKPIRFADKSGRNYTNKPLTKYTLIDSQFERYTIDGSRSNNGEPIYVRQSEQIKFKSQFEIPTRDKQRRQGSHNIRARRQLIESFKPELFARNQTLLNNYKSNLMYQYPPMYGYRPSEITTPLPAANITTPRVPTRMGGSDVDPRTITARSGLLAEPAKARPSPRGTLPIDSSHAANSQPSPAPRQTTRSSATSLTRSPTFNGEANDTDGYDHMLVAPKSININPNSNYDNNLGTNLRPRTPEGLNQNEVAGQLLYLTECVDYCPPDDHVELIFFRCMPKNWRFSLFPNAINVTRTFIDDILTDISHCYRELIYIFSLALVLSLALLVLLRFLASLIIWTCITLLVSLFLSMAIYSWTNYYNQIIDLNNIIPHDSIYADKLASSDKWLIGSIFLTFVAFAAIGTVIFMRKRILLVTMLFRESGRAIADMPLLLLQPVLTFAALITITAAWTLGLICLQSMKTPTIDASSGFVVFKAETMYKIMKWYHIFAFLWVSHFAIACQHYVIGAAVSKWYFSTDRYNLHSPIGTAISELILYYLGSVALGSFLVAIFKVVRIVTRQIQFLVQRNCMSVPASAHGSSPAAGNHHNQMISASSCCGSFSYVWRLFIWFFDNIVMIINRDAYVEVAIYGHSFLTGARRAFTVLATNPLQLLAIKSVSNILLGVAKICVVFGTISMSLLLLDGKTQQLNYSWSPVAISAIYAYVVAHWFLSVYEMVIDALFICYSEDYERSKNQGTINHITGSGFMSQILNNGQLRMPS